MAGASESRAYSRTRINARRPISMQTASDRSADREGVDFPPAADGRRGTTDTGRAVFADALRVADASAATAAERERDWRRRYVVHAGRLVQLAAADPARPIAMAEAGLASLRRRLQFVRDGASSALEALPPPRTRIDTRRITGISKAGPAPIAVPYRGAMLSGDALRRQLDRWEADGIVEPSFAQALWRVQSHPEWLDLSDHRFALLGAQAEMAPLPWLLRWRATVYAVDLPRTDIWQRLLRLAHAGNGTLCVPLRSSSATAAPAPEDNAALAQYAGADLLSDTPELIAWLGESEGSLTVGAYAYLDGAQHVRVAAAMDAIQAQLAAQRRNVSLAMLATPTDAYAVPGDALRMAHERFAARGVLARTARAVTLGRGFARNGVPVAGPGAADTATPHGVVDALVVQQGPNYVLAKRLQHWRALTARAQGTRVSIHVAPPALTGSVTKNRLLAAAYRAAHRFGAQAFEPATAAALMAALLVHDLRHPQAPANPDVALGQPLDLLSDAACHGGLWRMPYAARSALPMAALIGYLGPRPRTR